MENIKFIKTITDYINKDKEIIGDCVYYNLANGNKVKLWCDELNVVAQVINKTNGKIDEVKLPFANYFEPTQCSHNAPKWTQHIDNGKWYFEDVYQHVLPKDNDYMNLAQALNTYIEMYK